MMKIKEVYNNLSKQGQYACIASLVMLVNVFLTILHLSKKEKVISTVISLLFLYMLTSLVNVYLVNCLVKGKCELFAWYGVYSLFVVQLLALYKVLIN